MRAANSTDVHVGSSRSDCVKRQDFKVSGSVNVLAVAQTGTFSSTLLLCEAPGCTNYIPTTPPTRTVLTHVTWRACYYLGP